MYSSCVEKNHGELGASLIFHEPFSTEVVDLDSDSEHDHALPSTRHRIRSCDLGSEAPRLKAPRVNAMPTTGDRSDIFPGYHAVLPGDVNHDTSRSPDTFPSASPAGGSRSSSRLDEASRGSGGGEVNITMPPAE